MSASFCIFAFPFPTPSACIDYRLSRILRKAFQIWNLRSRVCILMLTRCEEELWSGGFDLSYESRIGLM